MRYEFIVEGVVPDDALLELPELAAARYPTGGTALFGPVLDDADVRSVLAQITALGLNVVEVRALPD